MLQTLYYNLSSQKTVKLLKTNSGQGLSEREVKLRQKKFPKNELPKEKPFSLFKIFLKQFKSPLIYILITAGIITLVLKEFTDSIVIFGAVFLNTIVGFLQEKKASQALKELKKIVRYTAEVLRGGNLKVIDSREIIPGDIIILNPGDKVPADGRIIESNNLKINEMALTGEWLSAEKHPDTLPRKTPLADRDNMVYMGTVVEDGKAKVAITATGVNTEMGKIASLIKETKEEKTPYQKKLAHFSGIIGIIVAIICLGIFIEGMLTGGKFIEMFTVSVAVAVAAIPEGLPVAMTVILALGMQKILKNKGLVRKLAAAETLGSTSIICTDKTATLTEGKMKVSEISGDKYSALKAGFLTSEAFIENPSSPKEKWILRGRPTDKALLKAGIEAGIDREKEFRKEKIAEIPFNPINKFAGALYQEANKKILYICGAPERILEKCSFKKGEKEKLEAELEKLTRRRLRVVASGYKDVSSFYAIAQKVDERRKTERIKKMCQGLIFAGFIALKDPVRKEVKQAIKICEKAGIKPIIVTGDHKLTAKAVAAEIGLKVGEKNIMEGKEIDRLSDEEFANKIKNIQIFARVEPKHKMKIIDAWQQKGEVVAMTGDGINDAPALKKADIGIAPSSGTEAAKETSDLILLNNSFSIIVAAVEQGRIILSNIRKVITYLLSDSFSEVILVGAAIAMGFPLPVTAAQILWTNLVEDGLPDIALAFEPKEKDLMQEKPQGRKISLLTQEMKAIIFFIGIITDLILLGLFFWLWNQNHNIAYVRTMIFACLAIDSLFYVFSCKSLRRNLWHINPFSNKFLIFVWIFGFIALIAALYVPILQSLLKTVPLGLNDWLIIGTLGIIELILIEATKWHFIVRRAGCERAHASR